MSSLFAVVGPSKSTFFGGGEERCERRQKSGYLILRMGCSSEWSPRGCRSEVVLRR